MWWGGRNMNGMDSAYLKVYHGICTYAMENTEHPQYTQQR